MDVRGLERDTRRWVRLRLQRTEKGWSQREVVAEDERPSGWEREYLCNETRDNLIDWFEADFATYQIEGSRRG